MTVTKDFIYAAVGFGDLAVEKIRKANVTLNLDLGKLREFDPKELKGQIEKVGTDAISRGTKLYTDLVKRGTKTTKVLRQTGPAKTAVAQTKAARSQTKSAVASLKKVASPKPATTPDEESTTAAQS